MEESRLANEKLSDIYIRPELEGFTTASFAKIAGTADKGYEATSSKIGDIKQLLAAHSIPLEKGAPRPSLMTPGILGIGSDHGGSKIQIDQVQIEGPRLEQSSQFENQLLREAGSSLNPGEIGERQERLYATDYYQEVGYRIERSGGRNQLVFEMREKRDTRLGIGLRYDSDYRLVGAIEVLSRRIKGSEVLFRSLLGRANGADLEWKYRPSGSQGFYLKPQGYYFKHNRQVFEDDDAVLSSRDQRWGFKGSAGYLIGNSTRIEGGYRIEKVEGQTVSGTELDDRTRGALDVKASIDTLDDHSLAQGGFRGEFSYEWQDTNLGSDTNLGRLLARGERFFSLSTKVTLNLEGDYGLVHGEELPFLERNFTGGGHFMSFSSRPFIGLQRDQIVSRHNATAGLGGRYQLFRFPLSFVKAVELGGRYRAGVFSRNDDLTDFGHLLHGFGGGVYLKTRYLGPISFEMGGTSQGDFNAYFSLGYFY
jgi:outer membrane protein assembly factor BamA